MKTLTKYLVSILLALTALAANAQRRITPVEPSRTVTPSAVKSTEVDKSRLVEREDSEGKIVLIDTVTGTEWVDSSAIRIPRMIYPKLYKVTAGINIWDAAMRCLGQDYGLLGLWGELNMHNRYFPRLEVGLGQASITPDGMNYTYKSPLSPYFKLGASYNVFYNSNPRYLFLVGLNYGLTPFKYSLEDITLSNGYWDETEHFNISSQNGFVGFLEVTFGVRVNIVDRLSVGWNLIFHQLLHENKATYGKPMYIPGYGKRGNSFTANLSVTWDFDLNKMPEKTVDTED